MAAHPVPDDPTPVTIHPDEQITLRDRMAVPAGAKRVVPRRKPAVRPDEPRTIADRIPGAVRTGEPANVHPAEQLAVRDRQAVHADAEPVFLAEEPAALKIAGHIAEGDLGGLRQFVNELEHGRGLWDVNPWRLVEHLAEMLMRRAQPAAEPVGNEAGDVDKTKPVEDTEPAEP